MKTAPYHHQQECFDLSKDHQAFAVLLEQGLGKTKITLDTAEHLFKSHAIEGLLVVAPSGVHCNWVRQEIPLHLDVPHEVIEWANHKKKTSGFLLNIKSLFMGALPGRPRRLRVLVFNVEAFQSTTGAYELAQQFLKKFPTLMVIDESTRIKTPRSVRTRHLIHLGRLARYRRILTGTPVTQSPFDIYSQFNFLDPTILGLQSFSVFKHRYGRFERHITRNAQRSWVYEELIRYVRLDELQSIIRSHSFRRLKSECLDLPVKIYKTIGVDMSALQKRLYQEMSLEGRLDFDDLEMLMPLEITRLIRCQQFLGGFLPDGRRLPDPNPRLDLLCELVDDHPGKMVIWARFNAELELICDTLKALHGPLSTVELRGGMTADDRVGACERFQKDPSCRFLIGQQQAGVGVDLFAAETVIYFSNTFSYEQRYQSEDRCHRIGLRHPVLYIDLIANGTVDEKIAAVLQAASIRAAKVLGDNKPKGGEKNNGN